MKIDILPSLLSADPARLGEEIKRVADSGADALHLDIMDGHFVPNLSYGPGIVSTVRRVVPTLRRHVHLMLSRPDLYIERFVEAGSQTLQIHVEADCDIWRALGKIRACGVRSGLVLRPQTPAQALLPYLPLCDEIMLMTVNPGYAGQAFMPEVLPKISQVRRMIDGAGNREIRLMVDGGINEETGVRAAAAGADRFVAGSYLFKQRDMAAAVARMRENYGNAYGKEVGSY